MWREETHIEKNPRFRDENQQQSQPTYDVKSKIHGSVFLLRVQLLKLVFYFINSWINLVCMYLQTQAKFNLWEVSALATPGNRVKFFLVSEIFLRGSFTASNTMMSFPLEMTEMTSFCWTQETNSTHFWHQIPRFKSRPHLWEGSALSTALSLPCSPGNSEILTKSDFVLRCQNLSCCRNSPSVEAFLRLTKLCHYRRHLGHL